MASALVESVERPCRQGPSTPDRAAAPFAAVVRIATGPVFLLMWAAEWPLDRFTDAGNTWGLGRTWANLYFVEKNPWLR